MLLWVESSGGSYGQLVDHPQSLVGKFLHAESFVAVGQTIHHRQIEIATTLCCFLGARHGGRVDMDEVGYDIIAIVSLHVRPRP
jgi:hypothetical protein